MTTALVEKVQLHADDPYADASVVKQILEIIAPVRLFFQINQTDLLAPTNAQLVSPIAGKISKLTLVSQVQVTTGGAVTVLVGTTTVVGLSITVPDTWAVGTVLSDTPTGDGTENVVVGSRIQIAPASAFASAGAVNGYIEITPV